MTPHLHPASPATGELFARGLYREHCCPVDASYAKDLAVIGRDIATTVLVDNTPLSFAYQPGAPRATAPPPAAPRGRRV